MTLLALSLTGVGLGQISPGPLSRAHQDLEGATQCTMCHSFGIGQRDFKCLDCHTEIASRLAGKVGYHARQVDPAKGQLDCARCHSDHNGLDFSITRFETNGFVHTLNTGFQLRGAHSTVECSSCHTAQFVRPAARASIKMKDLNRTFLGLPTQCASCHQDPHEGQLGTECATCHSEQEWTPAAYFNHEKTRYPLLGKHRAVGCAGCHTAAPGSDAPRYAGLQFATCENCHTDPHSGAFESSLFSNSDGSCSSCHITSGWDLLRAESGFDHGQTDFPLSGKHQETGCAQCHMSADFKQPIEHELCVNCHEDIHRGQFESRAAGSDCSNCHNEVEFVPSLFTSEQHQQSAFPLEGRHGALECASCHTPSGPDAKYMLGTTTCESCHLDPHAGQFADAPTNNQCETCHTQQEFHPSTFSFVRHQDTDFALTGAHIAIVCAECHATLPGPAASSPSILATPAAFTEEVLANAARQYHFNDQSCTSCHSDPHQIPQDNSATCETCHNTEQWTALRPFDHGQTEFELEGAHQSATCIGCHLPQIDQPIANAVRTASFSNTPGQCFQCHEDIHGGQFMNPGEEEDCATCHSISTWGAGAFDHQTTKFPLDGAHEEVGCASCHDQFVPVEGRQVRLYRGAPLECEVCHSGGIPTDR